MLASVVTSLVVPKVVGVTEYGYWQLFTFYISYETLSLLGVADGIYLRLGGCMRRDLPGRDLSGEFLLSLVVQLIFTSLMLIAAAREFLTGEASRAFVLVSAAIMLPLQCMVTFISCILQAINEVWRYSLALLVNRTSFLVLLAPMLLARIADYRLYIVVFIFAQLLLTGIVLYQGKSLFACRPSSLRRVVGNFFQDAKTGLLLTLATASSTIGLGVLRLCLDLTQSIETFGTVSLSLSMVTFILSFISQVGIVLFPALRRESSENRRSLFQAAKRSSSLILPLTVFLFPAIKWLIGLWLPSYSQSIQYLAFLLPICIYEGKMQIVYATFYKVARKERDYLTVSLAALLLGACTSGVCLLWFNNLVMALIALSLSYLLRNAFAGIGLNRFYSSRFSSGELFEMAIGIAFLVAMVLLPHAAIVVCALLYICLLIGERDFLKAVAIRWKGRASTHGKR